MITTATPRIVRIEFDGDEYRVPGPADTEAQAYYTNDRDDAEGTARAMFGGEIVTKIVRVENLTDGDEES